MFKLEELTQKLVTPSLTSNQLNNSVKTLHDITDKLKEILSTIVNTESPDYIEPVIKFLLPKSYWRHKTDILEKIISLNNSKLSVLLITEVFSKYGFRKTPNRQKYIMDIFYQNNPESLFLLANHKLLKESFIVDALLNINTPEADLHLIHLIHENIPRFTDFPRTHIRRSFSRNASAIRRLVDRGRPGVLKYLLGSDYFKAYYPISMAERVRNLEIIRKSPDPEVQKLLEENKMELNSIKLNTCQRFLMKFRK